jgi:hypothetical protein
MDSPIELVVSAGPFRFTARLETSLAPAACAFIRGRLPFRSRLVHARWSGEAVWVPMGETPLGLPLGNATSYPSPGQALLYPGGFSETEILIAYGAARFASRLGQLAGTHFLTVVGGSERLPELGGLALWEGAQDLSIEAP